MADESIDVGKILLSVLIFLAFVSTVYMIYNLVFFNYNKRIDKMRMASSSYSAQRMHELAEDSYNGNPTTVPNAVTMLRDFSGDTLLYIGVHNSEIEDHSKVFTYASQEDNIQGPSGIITCQDPVEQAAKQMLLFNGQSCYVQLIGYTLGSDGKYKIANKITDGGNDTDGSDNARELVHAAGIPSKGPYDAMAVEFHIEKEEN